MFRRRTRPAHLVLLVSLAAVVAAIALPAAASSAPPGCANQNNNSYDKLLECVTLDGVRSHQAAFQAIATANGGTRAAGTAGYDATVAYVIETLEDAGWSVDTHEFDFTVAQPIQQTAPAAVTHPSGGVTGSALGTVTDTPVTAIDVNLTPPAANTSGCDGAFAEPAVGQPLVADPAGTDDFAGFTAGNIALIQRGGCSFALKVANAQTAGAAAVILFNQGNTPAPDRSGVLTNVTAVPPAGSAFTTITIPVVGTSFASGGQLAVAGSRATVSVVNDPQSNVVAELAGRNDGNVVMAGAHLDSVPAGPGINDNGSGSAALLELAVQLGNVKPENTLRFAWWGAEESGLVGSTAYVEDLSEAELDRIALYMNYDMVGSPNYVTMVYDADESTFDAADFGVVVPEGSEAIEDLYESYYTKVGEPYDDTGFTGRSDYQAFIDNDIPSGGLFTGAEEQKTAAQHAIWGGTIGAQFDPCYHQACDTFANNNAHVLEVNSDLIAFAALTFAYSTASVNGVAGKAVPGGPFPRPAPAGPAGTFPDQTPYRAHAKQHTGGRGIRPSRLSGPPCEWSAFPVCSGIIDRPPDYELDDVLVVQDPKQFRALGDVFRARIVMLLRERAASTSELATVLETPKGTVGHHLKVLESAGLIRVVRTRKVRALTEKYYGRVARLFVLKGDEGVPDELKGGVLAATMLRQAADEVIAGGGENDASAFIHVRLTPASRRRFENRLNRLIADMQLADETEGTHHGLAFALFHAPTPLPPPPVKHA